MADSAQPILPKIVLYRGWKTPGEYVWSPFVTKVEARLRFAGIPYGVDAGSPMTAPRGKIPYISLTHASSPSAEAETLSDSTLMIRDLVATGVLPDINAELTPTERAHDRALRALLEDKLYFFHTWERWLRPGNYHVMRDHALGALPWPVRVVVGNLAYRSHVRTLFGQGTGRFSPEEIAEARREIWEGINDLLVEAKAETQRSGGADEPFWVLGGEHATEADCVLFSFINSVLVCTAAPESREVVRNLPVLIDYERRIHDRYFPDYDLWEQWE